MTHGTDEAVAISPVPERSKLKQTLLVYTSSALLCGVTIGCVGPTGTTPDPDTVDSTLVVFLDPDSEFSTTDVRDVDEQIVRFNGAAMTMVWVEDNSAFSGWEAEGNFLGTSQSFQVRFGTKDGERRAYFTETATATVCDIEGAGGTLSIVRTSVAVPQE